MPVDHDRRLLFIHIPKTGGTSVLTLLGLWKKERSPDLRMLFGDFGSLDLQHLTLSQAAQFLTPDEFASYFRFAFVRNPWDRAVSAALWRTRFADERVRDLRDFVDWAERVNRRGPRRPSDAHALPQAVFLDAPEGRPAVADVGRFENFAHDVRAILGRFLNLPAHLSHKLPHADRGHYRDYYHGNLRERVSKLYARDVEQFGYRF